MNQAHIVRAVRKYYDITQIDFAKLLNTSQSALSKIESSILELSAEQWIHLCQEFSLDPHCLLTGRIQMLKTSHVGSLEKVRHIGSFKIPYAHQNHLHSTVRSAWPFVHFFKTSLGEKKFEEFAKGLGYDKEYFIIMSNPLSILFVEEMVMQLIRTQKIHPSSMQKLFENQPLAEVNKYLISIMGNLKNFNDFLGRFVELVPNLYEKNSLYQFYDEKNFVVDVKDAPHVADLKLKPEFQAFRKQYNLEYFNQLRGQFFPYEMPLTMKTNDNGWQICKI